MRDPIIDTTRSLRVVKNPFGDEPHAAGFYHELTCPVSGPDILPVGPWTTFESAQEALVAFAEDAF